MKHFKNIIIIFIFFLITLNAAIALTEKDINYLFTQGIEGSLINPDNKELYFHIKFIDSKPFVTINKSKFEAKEFKLEDNQISFNIFTSDNNESKLLFRGNIYPNLMSGTVTDSEGKTGSWVIKMKPVRVFSLYSKSKVSSTANQQQSCGKNPMQNWTYDNSNNHYFDIVLKNSKKIPLKYHHFRNFPVKCWVEPMKSDWSNQIRTSLTFISYFIPTTIVNNEKEADLVIKLGNPQEIKEFCKNNKGVLGCGGPLFNANFYKGRVLLTPDIFETQYTNGVILHEITHAFGLTEHSKKPEDLMYPYSTTNNFSAADLNTLWLLYNQW